MSCGQEVPRSVQGTTGYSTREGRHFIVIFIPASGRAAGPAKRAPVFEDTSNTRNSKTFSVEDPFRLHIRLANRCYNSRYYYHYYDYNHSLSDEMEADVN